MNAWLWVKILNYSCVFRRPRQTPVGERRHYRVLELIVGFHYIGEENTCSGGIQTGANELAEEEGKNINEIFRFQYGFIL